MTQVVLWAHRSCTTSHHRTRPAPRPSLVTVEVIPDSHRAANAGQEMPTGGTVASGGKAWSAATVGTRGLPPRAHGPTVTVAVASIERRPTVSAASAARWTAALWAKMASVAGSFWGADSWRLSVESSP